jgi:hypothetical protein
MNDEPDEALIEAAAECLWRLYGYDPGIDGRHPETERVFRLDVASLIEGIERAGYRIVSETELCEECRKQVEFGKIRRTK